MSIRCSLQCQMQTHALHFHWNFVTIVIKEHCETKHEGSQGRRFYFQSADLYFDVSMENSIFNGVFYSQHYVTISRWDNVEKSLDLIEHTFKSCGKKAP
jgi:hypothetical protein